MQQSDKTCMKCDHSLLGCYADQGMKGILVKNPAGDKLFTNKKNTRINPYICTNCGYTEWYAEEPRHLQ